MERNRRNHAVAYQIVRNISGGSGGETCPEASEERFGGFGMHRSGPEGSGGVRSPEIPEFGGQKSSEKVNRALENMVRYNGAN